MWPLGWLFSFFFLSSSSSSLFPTSPQDTSCGQGVWVGVMVYSVFPGWDNVAGFYVTFSMTFFSLFLFLLSFPPHHKSQCAAKVFEYVTWSQTLKSRVLTSQKNCERFSLLVKPRFSVQDIHKFPDQWHWMKNCLLNSTGWTIFIFL